MDRSQRRGLLTHGRLAATCLSPPVAQGLRLAPSWSLDVAEAQHRFPWTPLPTLLQTWAGPSLLPVRTVHGREKDRREDKKGGEKKEARSGRPACCCGSSVPCPCPVRLLSPKGKGRDGSSPGGRGVWFQASWGPGLGLDGGMCGFQHWLFPQLAV